MSAIQSLDNHRRGVILLEAIIGLAIVGIVLATASLMIVRHARSTDIYLNLHRVQLAAESQIELLRIGALPLENASFTDESGIIYEVRVTDARGAWSPLRLTRVAASFSGKHGRVTRYEARAYVGSHPQAEGGGQ